MRPNPQITYAQQRCAVTANLRYRAQAAEAEIAAARAETDAIRAEMRALRAEIRAERADLIAFIESPAWARDLLVLARDRVRGELVSLSTQRKSCGECGSFGRGIYDGLLRTQIDALGREHRLVPEQAIDPIDWPVRMGSHTRQGRALRDDWLQPPAPRRRPAQDRDW